MITRTAVPALVAWTVVYAGATLLLGCSAPARTEPQTPEPASQASDAPPSTPKSAAPGAKPKSPRAAKPQPPTPQAVAPKKSAPDKPVLAASPVLKRWKVPPLDVPKDRLPYPTTNSVAINDDGSRVIVDNHPAVDVWNPANLTYVRVLPESPDWGWRCNAIITQDASRFYIRNDATKKLDTYDGSGFPIGSVPQIGFAPSHGLKRPGYDFAPRDYVMGSRLPGECGIFAFDPETGALRNVVQIKDIWDVQACSGLVRLPGGDFLAYYNPGGANKHRGLHTIAPNGTFASVPGLPSKDMKMVNEVTLSPVGRYLAFRGSDRLEVWDLQDRTLVLDWRQDYRTPRAGRFTGDGRLAVLSVKTSIEKIATSGLSGGFANNSARLDVLELPSLRVAGQLSLAEFDALIPAFAFSPNGKRLVVADSKQVALIDVERAFPGK